MTNVRSATRSIAEPARPHTARVRQPRRCARRTGAGGESCGACGRDDDVAGRETQPCRRIAAPPLTSTEREARRGQNGTSPVILKSGNRALAVREVNKMDGPPKEPH